MMIEINKLAKSYNGTRALRGINLRVEQGEIFGLLGPNGAGKTTTIRLLTGQLKPDSGQARIFGRDVFKDREKILKNLGVVPEETNLYERLTILQNLKFFCRLYQVDYARISEYLEMVGLLQEQDRQVKDLSQGMKQKVLLIRPLLHDPEILFLDEPTSGLDPGSASVIHRILQDLNRQGMTVLLTSHNMEEVDKLCHRVAFLNQGQLVEQGIPRDLKLQHSRQQIRVVFQEQEEINEDLLELQGKESAEFIAGLIAEGRLKAIHSQEPTLADIFVEITGRELD